jgi:hypothetical protein
MVVDHQHTYTLPPLCSLHLLPRARARTRARDVCVLSLIHNTQ